MCVSVITVIAPFTSSTLEGTAGQHHLGTRTQAHTWQSPAMVGLMGSQPATGGRL